VLLSKRKEKGARVARCLKGGKNSILHQRPDQIEHLRRKEGSRHLRRRRQRSSFSKTGKKKKKRKGLSEEMDTGS